MPEYDFLDGLTRCTSSRLNTEIVREFLMVSFSDPVLKISMRESISSYNIWFVYIGFTHVVVKVCIPVVFQSISNRVSDHSAVCKSDTSVVYTTFYSKGFPNRALHKSLSVLVPRHAPVTANVAEYWVDSNVLVKSSLNSGSYL